MLLPMFVLPYFVVLADVIVIHYFLWQMLYHLFYIMSD